MDTSKELVLIDFDKPSVVSTLKATVAQGLSDSEFLLFAEHCKSTGLNPFKREVWAIKANNRLQLMTGINGYFTIANRHPEYDGYEEGYIGKNGEELPDTYTMNDFVGAWCKVYRKDRKMPAKGVAFNSEYKKDYGNWKVMPRVMILKCAESIALRKAFPQELNGSYTAEEMPPEFSNTDPTVTVSVTEPFKASQMLQAQSKDTTPKSDTWTGELKVTGGKHEGVKWKDLDPSYVEWARHNSKNPGVRYMAEQELLRRDDVQMRAQEAKYEAINNEAEKAGAFNAIDEAVGGDQLPASMGGPK